MSCKNLNVGLELFMTGHNEDMMSKNILVLECLCWDKLFRLIFLSMETVRGIWSKIHLP